MNRFLKCGRVPYNPEVFSDIHFIVAKTTNQPAETESLKQDINFANVNSAEPIAHLTKSVSDAGSTVEIDNEIWDSTTFTSSAPEKPYMTITVNTSSSTSSPVSLHMPVPSLLTHS